jgi:hypothetical protein
MIVQAMQGIEVNCFYRKLLIDSPAMPVLLDWLNRKSQDGRWRYLLAGGTYSGNPAIELLDKSGPVTLEFR